MMTRIQGNNHPKLESLKKNSKPFLYFLVWIRKCLSDNGEQWQLESLAAALVEQGDMFIFYACSGLLVPAHLRSKGNTSWSLLQCLSLGVMQSNSLSIPPDYQALQRPWGSIETNRSLLKKNMKKFQGSSKS